MWRPGVCTLAVIGLMRSFLACLALASAGAITTTAAVAQDHRDRLESPLVIGHRGASGYLPEHTLESYGLAIELGADYIEPGVVATRDGHLVVRHEANLLNATDVAYRPEFASRRRTASIDGVTEGGFFTSDFTLAEIRKLRATQPFADRPQDFNGQFGIATLDEVIDLAKRKGLELHRTVGVSIETSTP